MVLEENKGATGGPGQVDRHHRQGDQFHTVSLEIEIAPDLAGQGEQATGAKMDKRSDLYALGVILFEMLEGRRPFIGDTSLQVLMAHVKDPVPLLSQEWDALNDVLAQLLAKSPADRFPDGQSVVMALSEASPGDVPANLL